MSAADLAQPLAGSCGPAAIDDSGASPRVVPQAPRRPTRRATVLRIAVGTGVLLLGTYEIASHLGQGSIPSLTYLLVAMTGVAVLANRGGKFARDWLPILLAVLVYTLAGSLVAKLSMPVHYTFQIHFERFIAGGAVPTVWLQRHLYDGHTGPLEEFTVVMYVSHFIVPLLLGFGLWWTGRREALRALLRSLLVVSVLGEITFVLLPTAPPWLAAEHGYLPPVHQIFKLGLRDLGLGGAAAHVGSAGAYDIVAAMPSLHAAWPLIGILVARKYRLGRPVLLLLTCQLAGVLFAIVYAGEHYVADALVGWVYAVAAFVLVGRYWDRDRFAVPRRLFFRRRSPVTIAGSPEMVDAQP